MEKKSKHAQKSSAEVTFDSATSMSDFEA